MKHTLLKSIAFLSFLLFGGILPVVPANADFACEEYPAPATAPFTYNFLPDRNQVHTEGIYLHDSTKARYFPSGLCFPSFNNAIDNSVYGDERDFLLAKRYDSTKTPVGTLGNSVAVYPNDAVLMNAFFHNNGFEGDPLVTATGVSTQISGFSPNQNGVYISNVFTGSQTFTQSLSSNNATIPTISDGVTVSSATGKRIRLGYVNANNMSLSSAVAANPTFVPLDYAGVLSGGAPIGSVGQETSGSFKGSIANSMYMRSYFFVQAAEYDLKIVKSVLNSSSNTYQQSIQNVPPASTLTYQVAFQNIAGMEASGVTVVDDYDERYLGNIVLGAMPAGLTCSDDGTKITCHYAPDLFLNTNAISFTYTATIKSTVPNATVINNTATVTSTPNYECDKKSDGITACVSDNASSAQVTVLLPPAPTCTLNVSPTVVGSGATVGIGWTINNAPATYAGTITSSTNAAWSSAVNQSTATGAVSHVLSTNTRFTLSIPYNGSNIQCSADVVVQPLPVPTCSLTVSPTAVASGGTVGIGWTINNAPATYTGTITSSTNASWTSTVTRNTTVSPVSHILTANTRFTLTIPYNGGTTTCFADVPVQPATAPTCTLTANTNSVVNGGQVGLGWTINNAPANYSGTIVSSTNSSWTYTVNSTAVSPVTHGITAPTRFTLTIPYSGGSTSCFVDVVIQGNPLPPTCTLSTNPTTVSSGGQVGLGWVISNAPATYSGTITSSTNTLWSAPVTQSTATSPASHPLTANTTFTLTIPYNGSNIQCFANVTVQTPAPPTCSLATNPTSVVSGGMVGLGWTINNAPLTYSGTITSSTNSGWSAPVTQNTTTSPVSHAITANTRFTLTIPYNGGSTSCFADVVLQTNPVPPTCTLLTNPTSVASGGMVGLGWSINNAPATYAGTITSSANAGWSTPVTQNTTTSPVSHAITANTRFTLTIPYSGGSATCFADVTLQNTTPPTCTSLTNNGPIGVGQTATLTWTLGTGSVTSGTMTPALATVNPNFTINGSGTTGAFNTAGTFPYTLNITGPGGTASCSTNIVVQSAPPPPTCTLSNNGPLTVGQAATISWTLAGGSVTSGNMTPALATANPNFTINGSGTTGVFNSTGTFLYTLNITGPGGTASCSTNVVVNGSGGGSTLTITKRILDPTDKNADGALLYTHTPFAITSAHNVTTIPYEIQVSCSGAQSSGAFTVSDALNAPATPGSYIGDIIPSTVNRTVSGCNDILQNGTTGPIIGFSCTAFQCSGQTTTIRYERPVVASAFTTAGSSTVDAVNRACLNSSSTLCDTATVQFKPSTPALTITKSVTPNRVANSNTPLAYTVNVKNTTGSAKTFRVADILDNTNNTNGYITRTESTIAVSFFNLDGVTSATSTGNAVPATKTFVNISDIILADSTIARITYTAVGKNTGLTGADVIIPNTACIENATPNGQCDGTEQKATANVTITTQGLYGIAKTVSPTSVGGTGNITGTLNYAVTVNNNQNTTSSRVMTVKDVLTSPTSPSASSFVYGKSVITATYYDAAGAAVANGGSITQPDGNGNMTLVMNSGVVRVVLSYTATGSNAPLSVGSNASVVNTATLDVDSNGTADATATATVNMYK
ncbi:MAG: hypothetical protein WCJ84_01095, partial [Candidatus Peregrinibacteria bacterium]